ncbi:hypothetical protein C8R45DRAFT_1165084 [Mycena sanguinolenta]|nr:hypothetical protein C8R45DRAFT_1165084 [Mycena sanguinolenta]
MHPLVEFFCVFTVIAHFPQLSLAIWTTGKAVQIYIYDGGTCMQYIAEAMSYWTRPPFVGGTGAVTGADCFLSNMPGDSTGIKTGVMWEESTTTEPAQVNGWSSTVANITAWRLHRCNHGDRFIPTSDAAIEFIFDFHNPHQFLDLVIHDILPGNIFIHHITTLDVIITYHHQQQLSLFLFLSISIELFSSFFTLNSAAAFNSCCQKLRARLGGGGDSPGQQRSPTPGERSRDQSLVANELRALREEVVRLNSAVTSGDGNDARIRAWERELQSYTGAERLDTSLPGYLD